MNAPIDMDHVASLAADPACAAILTSLLSERALRAKELSRESGVPLESVRAQLDGLGALHLITPVRQGGRRYYRLAGKGTVQLLQNRFGLRAHPPQARLRTGPSDPALRRARSCYGHLAGDLGVWLYDRLIARGAISFEDGALELTPAGARFLAELGVDVENADTRPSCRTCLDWSVRRNHLAGDLGRALLARFLELGWVAPARGSRAVCFTPSGSAALAEYFG